MILINSNPVRVIEFYNYNYNKIEIDYDCGAHFQAAIANNKPEILTFLIE